MAAENLPTFEVSPTAVTERNAEIAGTPFSDEVGTGGYNEYLGMNAAGSNAPGIGINTGTALYENGEAERPESWTLLDQAGLAREPQESQLIGGIDAAEDPDPTTNPQVPATNPVVFFVDSATPDVNDTANLVVADAAVAPGGILDTGTGAINDTDDDSVVGATYWARVPVA